MPASKRSSAGSKSRNGSRSKSEGKSAVSRAKDTSQMSTEELEGRQPSGEPDVLIDIRKVKVDEIYVDVEKLEAQLALFAKVGDLLQVMAGVHVSLGKVEVDIKGVEVEAKMTVRLEQLYDILDRALTTLDRNPQILESVAKTVDNAVDNVSDLGEKALGPGGAVSQTLDDVGQAAQQAVQPGGAVSEAAGGLTDAAGQALGPGGAVGQLGQSVGQLGQGLGQGVGQLGQGLGQGVGQLGQGLGQDVGQAAQGLGQAAGQAGQAAGGAVGQAGQQAGQAAGQAGQQAGQAAGQAGQQAGQAAGQAGQAAGQTAQQPGAGTQDVSKEDLLKLARQLEIPGRSRMSKEELAAAIQSQGQGGGS
jgi:hypothetical protein